MPKYNASKVRQYLKEALMAEAAQGPTIDQACQIAQALASFEIADKLDTISDHLWNVSIHLGSISERIETLENDLDLMERSFSKIEKKYQNEA